MIAVPADKLTPMIGEYLTEQTGMKLVAGMFTAMMIVNDQQDFVGGVVFSNFRKTDIEVSCAAETPAAWRPSVMRAVFKYVFEQLDCARCTSITTKGNKKARAFLEALGFQLEGNIRLGYDGTKDALIYGLLRSECRYLAGDSERDHGEEGHPASADSARSGGDGASAVPTEHQGGDGPSQPQPD